MLRLLSHLTALPGGLAEWLIADMPGALGRRLRRAYWGRRLRHMGQGVQIDTGVRIVNPGHVSIGDNCWLDHGAQIIAGPPRPGDRRLWQGDNPDFTGTVGEVRLGRNVHVANFCVLQGHGGLQIGDNITTASGSKVYSMSHHHANPADPSDRHKYKFSTMAPARDQSLVAAPVVLQDDAALGLNSVVLPGVTLGAGSWVAAGSVVTRSLPANVLAGGAPARVLREDLTPGWSVPGRG